MDGILDFGSVEDRSKGIIKVIGVGENVGSGFPKIIAAWKETNWGEPQLLNKLDVDEVELVLPVPSPKSAVKTVNETVNETVKVSATQKKILQLLHEYENITYEEVAQKMNISRATVGRHISILKKTGILKRVGEDKTGHWEVLEDMES